MIKESDDRAELYKVVDNLFSSLGLHKAEWLEDIRKGSCSLLRGRSKITYWPAVIHDQRIRR